MKCDENNNFKNINQPGRVIRGKLGSKPTSFRDQRRRVRLMYLPGEKDMIATRD